MKKLVIFDFWDTIVNYNFDPIKANSLMLKHSLKNPDNIDAYRLGMEIKNVFTTIRKMNEEIEVPFASMHYYVHRKLNLEMDEEYDELEYLFTKEGHSLSLVDGVKEFIEYILEKGYKIAILSNTILKSRTQERILKELLPNIKFSFIISTSEWVFRKPNIRIFNVALMHANMDPQDIYFIGDNFKADVMGSSNAGMTPIWYNPNHKGKDFNIDCIEVDSYQKLLQYFKNKD